MSAQVSDVVKGVVAGAMILSAVSPSLAATTQLQRKRVGYVVPFGGSGSVGSFTPAAADPRAAASFARGGLGLGGFRFTPSVSLGARRAVTVAVRARATPLHVAVEHAAPVALSSAITPSAYSLGAAVGWKRFALSGDVERVETGLLPGSRESADVALSFAGYRWSTRLQLAADRGIGETLKVAGLDKSYSLDLAGSYSLTRRLDVTGGVRYRTQTYGLDRLTDERRDSQAIYIGTAFKF